jgi:cytochrome c-type biogenesis protein CcmE
MTHRYIKIGITVVVLGLAFGGLLWSSLRDGTEYYKNVSEVVADSQSWQGKQLQIHGYVVPGTWTRRPDSLDYRFKVQSNPARQRESGGVIDASYTGILPDTFKDEAEVVLKGRFGPNGFEVMPNGVMAKCPSKYEEASKSAAAGS